MLTLSTQAVLSARAPPPFGVPSPSRRLVNAIAWSEDRLNLPRVNDRHTTNAKIPNVSGDDDQLMFNRRSSNQTSCNGHDITTPPRANAQPSPSVRDRPRDREQVRTKPIRHTSRKPGFQLRTSLTHRQILNPQSNLPDRDDATEKPFLVGTIQPSDHSRVRLRAHKLRYDVGLDQTPVHRSIGFGYSRSRSNTNPELRNGDSSKN